MDADDYLDRSCLGERWNTVKYNPGYDLYIFKTAFVNNKGDITGYFYNPNQDIQDIIYPLVKHKIPWHTMSPVWSSTFLRSIGGWNEEYERLQDVELNIRALLMSPDIFFSASPVDSYYRSNGMSVEKKRAASMGVCRLIKDYYMTTTRSAHIDEDMKDNIFSAFQAMLEGQFVNYIKNTSDRDRTWENLFLKTLEELGVAEEEIESVSKIFNNLQ